MMAKHRNWARYLGNSRTDPGRAIVELGARLEEARRSLKPNRYLDVIERAGISPREARLLANIGRRLDRVLRHSSDVRLPVRIRTLASLAELSTETLRQAVEEGLITRSMTESDAHNLRGVNRSRQPQVIRPTDNWNFGALRWPRIDGWDGYGYVPGDLYANCLWYYSNEDDLVVDPMAGSGMLLQVWKDKDVWLNGTELNLQVVMSDIEPRGPHRDQIVACDLLEEFPTEKADYIIIDPPYCGVASGQYTNLPNDLANMDLLDWQAGMQTIAQRFGSIQEVGNRCTVIVPNSRTVTSGERVLFPQIVRNLFEYAGYDLYDVTYASRRTQRKQGRQMGVLNNRARKERVPLSDIAEVLTFMIK